MTSVNSEGVTLQRHAMARASVHRRSSFEVSVRTRPLPIFDSKPDELKAHVGCLYETHRDGIYRFLVIKGLSPTIAQELAQDVFVDLFVALEKGTQMEAEQGWLYAVAGRKAVDHWRRKHRQTRLDLDAERSAAADVPSSDPTPEAEAAHNEQLARVAAALRNLRKEERLCIQLRARGLRYREIAKVLHVSTSTAAEWLMSATGRLREQANGKSPLAGAITVAFRR